MAKVIDVKNDYVFIQNKDEYLQLRTYLCDFYPSIGDEVIILKDEKGNISKVVLPITLKGLDENQEVKEEVKVEVKKEEKKKVVTHNSRKFLLFSSILAIIVGIGLGVFLYINPSGSTFGIYNTTILVNYGIVILLALITLFMKNRIAQIVFAVLLFIQYLGAMAFGYLILPLDQLMGILTLALWGLPSLASILYFIKLGRE